MSSEQFNQDILNSLTAHIAVLNREGKIMAVNEAWRRFGAENGVKDSAAAGVGANYFAIATAGGAAEIEAGLRAVSLGQLPHFQMEYPCHAPAEPRWYLLHAVPLRDEAGAVVVSHTNITPLKEAELAHQKSEARFRNLAENSPDIVYILDLNNFQTLYFNRTEVLGYPIAEMDSPGSIFEAVHPADAARLAEHWQGVRKGKTDVIEYRLRAKSGQWEWLQSRETTLAHNVDGSPAQILVSLALITGRKQAEVALRESRNLLQQVITSISDHVYATAVAADGSKTNLYVSPNVQDLTGYSPEAFLTDWDSWASTLIHPDDRAIAASQAARLSQSQDSELEYRIVCADGRVIWVRDSGRVVHEADGRRVIYGVVSDITKRKQTEEKLRESEEKFRLMAENISDGILIMEANHQLVYASPLLDVQLGLADGETARMSSADIYEIIHPEDRAETFENIFQAISQKSNSLTYTYRAAHAAGHYIWREDHARFNYDRDGAHINTYVICRDITQRKQAEAGLQQRNRELEFLNRVGQMLVSTLDLEPMLADVLEKTRQLLNVFGCSAWLVDPDDKNLVCLQAANPNNELLRGYKLPLTEGVVGWTVRHGQSVLMGDTRTDPRHYPEIDRQIGVEMRSLLVVPLRVKQVVIGVLEAVDTTVNRFTPTDLSLIESLAASAAIVIENARLFYREHRQRQAVERTLRETQFLYRVSRILVQTRDVQAAVSQVLGEYLHALDLTQGGIALFDPEKKAVQLYVLYRRGQVQPGRVTLEITSRVYQQLIETRQPVVIAEAGSDPLLADSQELTIAHGIKSILFVPLLVQGQVIGALGADATEQPRHFSAREINLGQAVADQVAGAVDRIRLDESQRRLSAAMAQATETFIITDLAGQIVYANHYLETGSGDSVAEALGQNPNILHSSRQDPTFYEELWSALRAGETWHGTFINKRKDGRLYHEEASIFPVKNATGEVINYATVKRDITERVQAEAEREKIQAQLSQAQKMESVGRLAGGVAHDFNNMLTIIFGYTELALDQVGPDRPIFANLQEIRQAAERSADLTRQLLAFARKQPVAPRVLDLNETVEGMLKMLRRLIGENIDLVWRPGQSLGPVRLDPSQIDQLLANLCLNARDAITGVGQITIETGSAAFDEAYCAAHPSFTPGEYVSLEVRDDGSGMDQETLAKVFEPFFTTKEMGQGTGLGLATVYGIVEQNQGFINVSSEPGQGTTFKIYLPRHTAKVLPLPKEEPVRPDPLGHETVLLVEDEPAILEIGKLMLENFGYRVLAASTPGQAIRLAEQYPGEIHLLMTDVVMPGMNGRELTQRLLSLYPNLKHLFMSGYSADIIASHGVFDESVNFIQKPFSMKDLAARVRQILGQA